MAGEEWARRVAQKEPESASVLYDDGSVPGVCGLRIGPSDSPSCALEGVGGVDSPLALMVATTIAMVASMMAAIVVMVVVMVIMIASVMLSPGRSLPSAERARLSS
ncbi:MAG: hypothetical protein JXA57_05000 [Armatimonadetes bacterium]|nr:hypothetical protein [Armatimonadota bacterium]